MSAITDPTAYEDWYHTPRGRWIGDTEFALMMHMMRPHPGASLLDVGCGTGYFSRRFAEEGPIVTALDPDEGMLAYARTRDDMVRYLRGDVLTLPFADRSFDHCVAVTSLCFVTDPVQALHEMLRVARQSVVLGLLNRHSRLYRQKHDRGGYRGARWDSIEDIRRWLGEAGPNVDMQIRTAIFFPGGGRLAQLAESCLSKRLPWGGFLAAALHHR